MKREDIPCCFRISPIPSLPLPINQRRWVPSPYSRISTGARPRHSPRRVTSRAAPGSPVGAQLHLGRSQRVWRHPLALPAEPFPCPLPNPLTLRRLSRGQLRASPPPRGPARAGARALSPLWGRGSARLRAGLAPTPPPPPRGPSLTVSSLSGLQRDGTGRGGSPRRHSHRLLLPLLLRGRRLRLAGPPQPQWPPAAPRRPRQACAR